MMIKSVNPNLPNLIVLYLPKLTYLLDYYIFLFKKFLIKLLVLLLDWIGEEMLNMNKRNYHLTQKISIIPRMMKRFFINKTQLV